MGEVRVLAVCDWVECVHSEDEMSEEYMTPKEVLRMIERLIGPATNAAMAKQWKVSPQYLHDVRHGRREPGPAILDALGLRKFVMYESPARRKL